MAGDVGPSEAAEVLNRARSAGFLEFYSVGDLVNAILNSTSEVNAILYRQGLPPALFNAAVEGDYVSLAVLDLNLIDAVPMDAMPRIKEDFNRLEDITTELSYQSMSGSVIPFLFPVRIDEPRNVMYVVLGVKTATRRELFNEGFVEGLLEDLDFNYDAYFNQLIGLLLMKYSQGGNSTANVK
ncbi:hypothetical protein [Vulcanisaeta thermophila]|uniref:hypothetical protein n=1 Tax=Vulcanisaeta thermophila TaxID=867917 RepID=UPI000A02BBA4|nr:hypothetical protein [Vulcanisaeta thermophila]